MRKPFSRIEVGKAMNRFWQITFRITYQLARCYWFVARPTSKGAYVAVWLDGRVLVIRNSYKRVFSLPAGGVNKGETFQAAAMRELREEVGIVVEEDRLVRFNEYVCLEEFKHDTTVIFELHLHSEPAIAIDQREVVEAKFLSLEDAAALPLSETVRRYLAAVQAGERNTLSVSELHLNSIKNLTPR